MEPCFCQKFDLLTQTSDKTTQDWENNFKSQVIKLKFWDSNPNNLGMLGFFFSSGRNKVPYKALFHILQDSYQTGLWVFFQPSSFVSSPSSFRPAVSVIIGLSYSESETPCLQKL